MARRKRSRSIGSARLAKIELEPYGLGANAACAPATPGKAIRVCITRPEKSGPALTSPSQACRVLRKAVASDREAFYAVHLDAGNRVIGVEEVARGTLTSVEVHPREIFKSAFLTNAAALILAHNHPSGDPTPSTTDIDLTRRLNEAGRLLGVPVRDHIIIGADHCESLRERDLVEGFDGSRRRRRRRRRSS